MRTPRLYLGTMTFAWSQTSSKVDERVAVEMSSKFASSVANDEPLNMDTARIYAGGKTESVVGHVLSELQDKVWSVCTKAHPSQPAGLSKDGIQAQFDASANAMSRTSFDEYYLHQPDTEYPLLESLKCLHKFCQEGKIRKIGMSNYHVSEMKRAFQLCKDHGLTPPTVYQGLYNPLNRAIEDDLLPVLRENNCSFVAYNPLAAGLLTGKYTTPDVSDVPKGRFRNNQNYLPRFYTDVNFQAMELIRQACNVANTSMVEATYRWLLCHSALSENDGVLLGASSVKQLEQNLASCEAALAEMNGKIDPLPPAILEAFDKAWILTHAAGVFPYWRSYSSDMPERESLDQGASYDAKKK